MPSATTPTREPSVVGGASTGASMPVPSIVAPSTPPSLVVPPPFPQAHITIATTPHPRITFDLTVVWLLAIFESAEDHDPHNLGGSRCLTWERVCPRLVHIWSSATAPRRVPSPSSTFGAIAFRRSSRSFSIRRKRRRRRAR